MKIYYCEKITDAGITALARGLPQLQSLYISDCGNITDEGIRALATGCTQLRRNHWDSRRWDAEYHAHESRHIIV